MREGFGNPWMSNLEEIVPPEPVPFTPETIGWYLLAGILVLALLWIAWRMLRRRRANAYRRVALSELATLESGSPRPLPELLKRVALAAYPRRRVAELTGEAWLGFLDGTLATTDFTRGVGRWLPRLAYEPDSTSALSDTEKKELFALARRWVRGHRVERPS